MKNTARKKKAKSSDGWVTLEDVYEAVPCSECILCGRKFKYGEAWKHVSTKCRTKKKLHTESQLDKVVVWRYIHMRFGYGRRRGADDNRRMDGESKRT